MLAVGYLVECIKDAGVTPDPTVSYGEVGKTYEIIEVQPDYGFVKIGGLAEDELYLTNGLRGWLKASRFRLIK